jgi:hypothetical protein
MKCPHCSISFHDVRRITNLGTDIEGNWAIESYKCPNPECKKSVHYLIRANIYQVTKNGMTWWDIYKDAEGEEVIFYRDLIRPKGSTRPPVPIEVPKYIADDYEEACLVLPDSSKASAALSRRCLQNLLRDAAGVKSGDLASEIQQVLDSGKLHTQLAASIDAIRNIGNFAAHPMKSKSTGEIVPVEPGEAEWNLDVIELLFDFYYVQPAIILKKRAALDAKLKDIGKPAMK